MLPPGTACHAAAAAALQHANTVGPRCRRVAGREPSMPAGQAAASSGDRPSEGTAAAGCRLRFELERRTEWPAGRAGPGA
eukprot:2857884-Prymnesium_polylepis.1